MNKDELKELVDSARSEYADWDGFHCPCGRADRMYRDAQRRLTKASAAIAAIARFDRGLFGSSDRVWGLVQRWHDEHDEIVKDAQRHERRCET